MVTLMLTHTDIVALPSKTYADPTHTSIGESESQGHMPSPNAIGGYYGIQWYCAFENPKTKERYKVHCTDGVYGGHGPFKNED